MSARAPFTAVELDNDDAVRLFAAMFEVEDDGDGPVFARIRYLQKIGFPAHARAGRGKRVLHDLDAILQLAIVLNLIDLGIPATRATVTVGAFWRLFAHQLAVAWCESQLEESPYRDRDASGPTIVALSPGALGLADGAIVPQVISAKALDIEHRLVGTAHRGSVLVSLAAMVALVRDNLQVANRYRPDEIASAFRAFAAEHAPG